MGPSDGASRLRYGDLFAEGRMPPYGFPAPTFMPCPHVAQDAANGMQGNSYGNCLASRSSDSLVSNYFTGTSLGRAGEGHRCGKRKANKQCLRALFCLPFAMAANGSQCASVVGPVSGVAPYSARYVRDATVTVGGGALFSPVRPGRHA